MNVRTAEVLMVAIVSARASGFMFGKLLLESMGPFTLLALRFLFGFVLVALIIAPRLLRLDKATFKRGLVLGALGFIVMALEVFSLMYTASSTTAFLENTAIVLVPLFEALLARKPPNTRTGICAVLAFVGVGMLTFKPAGFSFGLGEWLAVGAAVFYAIAIMATARFSQKSDSMSLGALQVGFVGLFGLMSSFSFEQPMLPSDGLAWAYLAVLVVVCTGFGFTLQPLAQRYMSPEKASTLSAANPMVAAILGIAFMGEQVTLAGIAGMVFIVISIIVSTLPERHDQPR